MKLFENTLKKIIKGIEEYAPVIKIEINNGNSFVAVPKSYKVIGINLNKPNTYTVTFVLGEEYVKRGIKE